MGHLGSNARATPVIKGSARRIGGNAGLLAWLKQSQSFAFVAGGRDWEPMNAAPFGDSRDHFTPGPPFPNAGSRATSQRFVRRMAGNKHRLAARRASTGMNESSATILSN